MEEKCKHTYGEVVEVLPSEIHSVMAGSDYPILLYKCRYCGRAFFIHGYNMRHANAEDIIQFKKQHIDGKFYNQGFCEPTSAIREDMIEKACEWLKGHASAYGCAESDGCCGAVYHYDCDLLVRMFTKAMKGE